MITGATRGIGLAIARRAAQDGANIALIGKTDRPHRVLPGTIHTAAEEIEAAGGHALPLAVDLRDADRVSEAVERVVERFGALDILVNNASAIQLTGTLDTAVKRFDLMHQVNARGSFVAVANMGLESHVGLNPGTRFPMRLSFLIRPGGGGRGDGVLRAQVRTVVVWDSGEKRTLESVGAHVLERAGVSASRAASTSSRAG